VFYLQQLRVMTLTKGSPEPQTPHADPAPPTSLQAIQTSPSQNPPPGMDVPITMCKVCPDTEQ
jgi:hypothetical protein